MAWNCQAQDAGSWIVRAGVYPVQPKTDNHPSLSLGDGVGLAVAGTYFFAPRWGVEFFASLPIEHDLRLTGSGKVGETKQVLPTLTLQYHVLDPNGRVRLYAGVGVNYTHFFDERTSSSAAFADSQLDFESSFGPALQLGLDLDIDEVWFVSVDGRWFDIDAGVTIGDVDFGTVQIDPYAFGMSIGRRLR